MSLLQLVNAVIYQDHVHSISSACASSEGEFPSLQLRLLCSACPDAQSIPAQSAWLSLSPPGGGGGLGGRGGEDGHGESWICSGNISPMLEHPWGDSVRLEPWPFSEPPWRLPTVRIAQWFQANLWNQNPSFKVQLFLLLCDLGKILNLFSTQFLYLWCREAWFLLLTYRILCVRFLICKMVLMGLTSQVRWVLSESIYGKPLTVHGTC